MFQEIRSTKPSLRDVLPAGKSAGTKVSPKPPPVINRERRRSRFWPIVIILLLIGGAALFASSLMARAVIAITAKQLSIPLDQTVTADQGAAPAGQLGFETLTIAPVSQSQTLPATGSQAVSVKATGQVIISNNFSAASQLLVKSTRLESSQGKIYRLTAAVTVPGQKSVEARVEADQPGPDYNIPLSDFTIPGFKGGPRYSKFSARSKTPMTGGSSGVTKTISPADRAKADVVLRAALVKQALAAARTQVPPGHLIYDGATSLKFAEELTPAANDQATFKETLTLTAVVFEEKNLSNYLVAKRLDKSLAGLDFAILNLPALKVSLNNSGSVDLATAKSLALKVSGLITVAMTVDGANLRSRLAGKSKDEAPAVFRDFPAIETATVALQPPWLTHFPLAPERIIINL